jgi:anti-sigma regulatory factor (Ser/Thr protein kinase)
MRILTTAIHTELDVVMSRQRARQVAALCGFAVQDQVHIATSVSELARNVYNYAQSGRIEFSIEGKTAPQVLVVLIEDQGPGIANLELILSGRYQSDTGMGLGLIWSSKTIADQDALRKIPARHHFLSHSGAQPVGGGRDLDDAGSRRHRARPQSQRRR